MRVTTFAVVEFGEAQLQSDDVAVFCMRVAGGLATVLLVAPAVGEWENTLLSQSACPPGGEAG